MKERSKIRLLQNALLVCYGFFFSGVVAVAEPQGLSIFPENPRYFAYDGKPIFLTGRSFGWTAISDPELDYVRDIDTNAAHGGNLLRLTRMALT